MKTREQLIAMAEKYKLGTCSTATGKLRFDPNDPQDFARKILKIKKGKIFCYYTNEFVIYIDVPFSDEKLREIIHQEIKRRREDRREFKIYQILTIMKEDNITLLDLQNKNNYYRMGVEL